MGTFFISQPVSLFLDTGFITTIYRMNDFLSSGSYLKRSLHRLWTFVMLSIRQVTSDKFQPYSENTPPHPALQLPFKYNIYYSIPRFRLQLSLHLPQQILTTDLRQTRATASLAGRFPRQPTVRRLASLSPLLLLTSHSNWSISPIRWKSATAIVD